MRLSWKRSLGLEHLVPILDADTRVKRLRLHAAATPSVLCLLLIRQPKIIIFVARHEAKSLNFSHRVVIYGLLKRLLEFWRGVLEKIEEVTVNSLVLGMRLGIKVVHVGVVDVKPFSVRSYMVVDRLKSTKMQIVEVPRELAITWGRIVS